MLKYLSKQKSSGGQARRTGDAIPALLLTCLFLALLTLRPHAGDVQYPFTDIEIEYTTMIPPYLARTGKSYLLLL